MFVELESPTLDPHPYVTWKLDPMHNLEASKNIKCVSVILTKDEHEKKKRKKKLYQDKQVLNGHSKFCT